MTMQAPSGAAGRTRCPGCSKRFADDAPGRATQILAATETTPGRSGYRDRQGRWVAMRARGERQVGMRWHTDCLAAEHERNEAYRRQVALDRRAMIETLAAADGRDVTDLLAKYDRDNGLV